VTDAAPSQRGQGQVVFRATRHPAAAQNRGAG